MDQQAGSSIVAEAMAVDYAYQPIVSTSTLQAHGFEALARPNSARFTSVIDLLNCSHDLGELRRVERTLVRAAIRKFSRAPQMQMPEVRLFCNVDNRAYDGAPMDPLALIDLIGNSGIPASNLCIEVSERQPVSSYDNLRAAANTFADHDALVAIDDFGIGNSGLHMLLRLEPAYVKVDQFFVDGLAGDTRKQAIVAKLCGLAHALGFRTVAEGVENEADFRMARDLGCDLAQGYHIARPTTRLGELSLSYQRAITTRQIPQMAPRVSEFVTALEPLHADQPMADAAKVFQENPSLRLLPVVADDQRVRGAVFEEDVRQLMLSEFGRSLLANKGMNSRVSQFLRRCAVAEATATVEAIVNSYVAAESSQGLILVNDGRLVGYLSNNSVLRLAAEREVSMAREQNPLTKLPGNESIERHWHSVMESEEQRVLVLLDFDSFKAFNDSYGFAMGDRALLIFAHLLRRLERAHDAFVGHIGGDDFLLSLPKSGEEAGQIVAELQERFARDAESLYSADDRQAGGITAIDRFGVARFFALLRVSAGVLHLPQGKRAFSRQEAHAALNGAKSAAKRSESGFAALRMGGDEARDEVRDEGRAWEAAA
jgi:diguanylate cyclase (GGDEF)-like protein